MKISDDRFMRQSQLAAFGYDMRRTGYNHNVANLAYTEIANSESISDEILLPLKRFLLSNHREKEIKGRVELLGEYAMKYSGIKLTEKKKNWCWGGIHCLSRR